MSGVSFSLSKKGKKKANVSVAEGFEQEAPLPADDNINPDLPKEPLVIPVQEDARKSLQEQARLRREQQEEKEPDNVLSAEDQAAVEALQAEADGGGNSSSTNKTRNMVIASNQDTFQKGGQKAPSSDKDQEQLHNDLERLAPELSVDSNVYHQVPIGDFGAAMLRGMGWTGSVDKSDTAQESLPRPSRLGLGATPKLLEGMPPTHGRKKPRRQDQLQRDHQLKQQQAEYEQQRLDNIKRDKQRTIQVGSIVEDSRGRAIIRKWQGVPGLNMILIQYENDAEPIKVKRGSVELVDRRDLEQTPFHEPMYKEAKTEYLGEKQKEEDRRSRDRDRRRSDEDADRRRRRRDDYDDDDRKRRRRDEDEDERRRRRRDEDYDEDRKKRRSEHEYDDDRRRKRSSKDDDDDDRRRRKRDDEDRRRRRRDRDEEDRRKSKKQRREDPEERRKPKTWLIPNIRVRVITSKLGKSYYKEKGVVVDVTAKGTATLKMNGTGQVLQVPEKYLETALPKVGGNACILTGDHRWAKGKLLERDSKSNKGAIQVFQDMNIVTTSLDDMAEWCGPLDDDLME